MIREWVDLENVNVVLPTSHRTVKATENTTLEDEDDVDVVEFIFPEDVVRVNYSNEIPIVVNQFQVLEEDEVVANTPSLDANLRSSPSIRPALIHA